MNYAVETKDLTRIFRVKKRRRKRRSGSKGMERDVTALKDVTVLIEEGELFGLLGPNGAGKTTLIKILCTLLLPTSGKAYVAGHDVEKDPYPIRRLINMVSGGEISGYGLLTTRENLWMFSQFYGIPSKVAKKRIDEMLEIFGIWDKRNAKVRTLSTGERQKANVIRGFMTDPSIIFLDEPTLGLDVSASRIIRRYINDWVRKTSGRTVLLTTHYMMEADELCDRLAIIDEGRIVACDTPRNLKRLISKSSSFTFEADYLREPELLKGIDGVKNFSYKHDGQMNRTSLTFIIEDESSVADIVSEIVSQGSKIHALEKREPTLEDVFVSLVGKGLE
ncbi:MAG: ATP-binding cassette domain-containing protein [Thermoplasmata archaeon]